MERTIRWGILGTGRIARKFASDLKLVQGATLVAIGSRNMEAARSFAGDFPLPHLHDSYEALAANQDVDIIYIATPHHLHHSNTLLCLQHNKAVLCEKPFAINLRETKEMIALARDKNVFLMEAIWTKFLPHYIKTKELIDAGKLGTIKSIIVNFGFKPNDQSPARLFDPAMGGGSLMDIGIYNVFMALGFLGKPDRIDATMNATTSGIDEQCAVQFTYNDGAIAQLFSTLASNIAIEADINGTEGKIRLTNRFYEPSSAIEYYPGFADSKQIIEVSKEEGVGYQYEARHACDCLCKGLVESPIATWNDTIAIMETLDAIRMKAGIHYAADR